jgi:tetratricopeptide (TPR) repeat protein
MLCVVMGVAQPPAVVVQSVSPQQAVPASTPPAVNAPVPKAAAPGQAKTPDTMADAYFQFITGRRLAADGENDAALKALKRASELDPGSSQVLSELAELYARQGELAKATDTADAALKIDANNFDAHRLLGMIYADLADRGESGRADGASAAAWTHAVDHLEKALGDGQSDLSLGIRLTLGRMYAQRKNYDKAIASLKQLLADSPWQPQGVAALAETYTSAGRQNDAIALLKDAVVEEPSFYRSLAEAYDAQQQYAEAASAYEKASQLNPRDGELKTRWAAALLGRPETASAERARTMLLEVTKSNPTSSWAWYLLARAQRFLDDLDGAELAARRILALSPTSTSGAHALAQVFEARRQYSKIVETLEPVVAKPQKGREADMVLLLTHLGFSYLELGRGTEAVGVFEKAIALDPADSGLKAYRAQGLLLAKKYDLALTLVRELRAALPYDFRLAKMEADALKGQGKFDAGLGVLTPLVDTPTTSAAGALALSEFYAADHRYVDAAALLKAASAKFPKDLNLQFQYGAMLERLKKHDDAVRVLQQVVAADANHAPALNYLGYTLVEKGQRLLEALEFIKRAVTLDPYNGSYLDSLGFAYLKLNQPDAAEAPLRTAAEQLPRDSIVQEHFGDVLAAKRRWAEAIDAWRRSLAGDGEAIDRATLERKIRDAQSKAGKS